MRYLYTLFYWLILPGILIRLWWRGRVALDYRQRMLERLGYFTAPKQPTDIWIHAVSLGEVIAATLLIRALQQQYPTAGITVTTMTYTGSQRVREIFGDSVFHVYIPYDLPSMMSRFIARTKPRLLIVMETELWPNLLSSCHKHKIPVLLANARLSAQSAHKYQKIIWMTQQMLQQISIIAAQTQLEAQRYIALGAPQDHVKVTGSIKFDISLPEDLPTKAKNIRHLLGEDRLVWIAASTHEGEEEQILQAFAHVRQQVPHALLFIVPRHPERFSKVANLCRKQGYEVVLRSENKQCTANTAVIIGDTMGELLSFYAAADVAFVGGSLMPIGGHNLLEPAAIGIAAVTGPHMHNFVEITALLLQANAVEQIKTSMQLAVMVTKLLQDETLRQMMGKHGQQAVINNRGALQKHMELIGLLYLKPTID